MYSYNACNHSVKCLRTVEFLLSTATGQLALQCMEACVLFVQALAVAGQAPQAVCCGHIQRPNKSLKAGTLQQFFCTELV